MFLVFLLVFAAGGVCAFEYGSSGVDGEPYLIETLEHLDRVRDDLSANYKLINDIDASPTSDSDSDNWNAGAGWDPIRGFRGDFDGGGHTISNLFIDRGCSESVGLFSGVGGTVKNIGLVDVDITGRIRVGGLVGQLSDGNIINSYVTGTVKGSSEVGGLVGYNSGVSAIEYSHAIADVIGIGEYRSDIGGLAGVCDYRTKVENSYFKGMVSGHSSVGGLVGTGRSGNIKNSYSEGAVSGGSGVGGLVGAGAGNITNSYATGDVTGTDSHVGGLAGSAGGDITNSYAIGNVYGGDFVGGLVGVVDGNIINSYAAGDVTGTGANDVGGLAGALSSGVDEVVNSYAAGDVYAPNADRVGGFVGSGGFMANIKESFAIGNVTGANSVGGFAGISSPDIANSYSIGKVTGEDNVGGFVGEVSYANITNSYVTGTVKGNSNVGGFAGCADISTSTIEDSFWDVDEDGLDTASGQDNSGATGKTTEEMKDISTFNAAGWDIRTSGRDFNDGYPYLSWELNGSSRVWLIFEEPAPEPEPEPDPEPDPEPEHPAPPAGFRVDPGDNFILFNHLMWGESETPGISSYRLYVSTGGSSSAMEEGRAEDLEFRLLAEFPADTFEYTHTGLSAIRYYYVITSVDEEGLESDVTSPVYWANPGTGEYGYMEPIPWPGKIIDEPDDDDSSSCFIATAAYGSAMSSEVMRLRDFRDGLLLASWAGNRIVGAYYATSPALAEAIAESRILRRAARLHLAPLAKFAGLFHSLN